MLRRALSKWTEVTHRPGYAWVVMAMGFLAVFGAIGLGRFGYSAILPEMQTQLGLSGSQAGGLASWNLAGYVVLAVIGGVLATRFGVRLMVSIGVAVATVGMAVTGFADGVGAASVARLLTGFGGGLVLVPSTALMSAWFPRRRRGLASGIVSSGMALGLIVSGPLVPRIIGAGGDDGWRMAWFTLAAMALVLAVANPLAMRNRPHEVDAPRVPRPGEPLDMRCVVSSGYAWHLGFVYMMWGYAYMIYFVFLQKRLIGDLGFSAEAAGNVFMILGVASLVCGFLWGFVSDRMGRTWAMVIMLAGEGVASALFAFVPGTGWVIVSAVLFGLTAIGFVGIVGAACGDRFGAHLAPASMGFVTLFVGVGQAIGPVVAGVLEDRYGSLAPAFVMSAGVFALATVTALFLRSSVGHDTGVGGPHS